MQSLAVGIEHKTEFVDSTLSNKLKLECPKYKLNSKDASVIATFPFATPYIVMRFYAYSIRDYIIFTCEKSHLVQNMVQSC